MIRLVVIICSLQLFVYQLSRNTFSYSSLLLEFCFQGHRLVFSCCFDFGSASFLIQLSWCGMRNNLILYSVFLCQIFTICYGLFRLRVDPGTCGSAEVFYGRLSSSIMSILQLLKLSYLSLSNCYGFSNLFQFKRRFIYNAWMCCWISSVLCFTVVVYACLE